MFCSKCGYQHNNAPYCPQCGQAANALQIQINNNSFVQLPSKSRVAYVLLGIFLGHLGIHNFYAGYTGKAIAQLLLTIFLFWTVFVPLGVALWAIIEVCVITNDAQGRPFA